MSPEEFFSMNFPKKEVPFLSSVEIKQENNFELLEDQENKVELLENKENNSLDFPQIKVEDSNFQEKAEESNFQGNKMFDNS